MTEFIDDTAAPNIARPGDDQFELTNWPFYWIVKANGRYVQRLEESLKSIELDVPRWRVLMLLERDVARSVSYLAKEAFAKLSTMTRIVQRMQEDGLVKTQPRESDQRVTEVILTGNGRRARSLALQQADAMYAGAFVGMSHDDVKALNQLLEKVFSNLD